LYIPEEEGEWPISDSELMPLLKLRKLEQLRLREGPPLSEAAAYSFVFGWQRMDMLVLDWFDEEPEDEDEKETYLLVKEARHDAMEHVSKAIIAYSAGASEEGGVINTRFYDSRVIIKFPSSPVE
jgi:hypothetical protein